MTGARSGTASGPVDPGAAPRRTTPRWEPSRPCSAAKAAGSFRATRARGLPLPEDVVLRCSRCHHVLRREKPLSVQRTWGFLVAAAVLYLPANALPVMSTTSAFETAEHTLLGGIRDLWVDGAWGLSIIVFVASIAVPVLKIAALALLAWSVRKAPRWRRLERARLFRLIETGRPLVDARRLRGGPARRLRALRIACERASPSRGCSPSPPWSCSRCSPPTASTRA